jgi:nicotinate dehydrogenase subunit A
VAVRLVVDGRRVVLHSEPTTPLLWALRDELGCPSVRYGCGLEQCGACRVLIDRVPRAACRVDLGDVEGQQVETPEALITEEAGQRVVDALLVNNAGQCGYCLPGIVVTLIHLMRQSSRSADEILRALDDHLCRCGSQPRIIAAALDVLGAAS